MAAAARPPRLQLGQRTQRSRLLTAGAGKGAWRRYVIGRDLVSEHQLGQRGYGYIERVARFDHRFMGFASPMRYRVIIMQTRSTHVELPPVERFESREVYRYEVVVGGDRGGD